MKRKLCDANALLMSGAKTKTRWNYSLDKAAAKRKRKKKKERVDADTALRVIEKHFPGTSPIFKSRVLKLAKELESCSRGGKQ